MARQETRRRTTTLSISLTPELAGEISDRVRSGLYTSASELIREALRLLLKVEDAQRVQVARTRGDLVAETPSASARKFAATMELFDLGAALREEKLRRADPGSAADDEQDRLARLEDRQESGPGLRISPERLAKLRLRE